VAKISHILTIKPLGVNGGFFYIFVIMMTKVLRDRRLEKISLFRKVSMRQILITVLNYNNYNTILIRHYTLIF